MDTTTETWPPATLTLTARGIISHCEDLECCGVVDVAGATVHMAALLYAQDYQGARHLFRRMPFPELEAWYRVAAAMLQQDVAAAWQALHGLPANHPYVPEIADAMRRHCLRRWKNAPPPEYYAGVLGFASVDELHAFWKANNAATADAASSGISESLTQVVSFLESRTTADAVPSTS